tara:strand:+ start:166 stop:489 length:324 start_codon:yes stop_codon:yes gene_type:complete
MRVVTNIPCDGLMNGHISGACSELLYREKAEFAFPVAVGSPEDHEVIIITTEIPVYGCEKCGSERDHMRTDSWEAVEKAARPYLVGGHKSMSIVDEMLRDAGTSPRR